MDDPRKRSAADYFPPRITLASLRRAAATCEGCDLYKHATQTVFGEGELQADVILIGEEPGDQEDVQGHPFVGPAGKILNKALADAGLGETKIYVTNAVKHFKWERRGKRRLHKRPDDSEIRACNPWLVEEIALIRPAVVTCLGVTAARAVFGRTVRLKDYRGTFTATPLAPVVFVTVHPSAILRLPESEDRHREYERFVSDLRQLQGRLNEKTKAPKE